MENKHNAAIKALHTITDRILKTPPLTQVEDVKRKAIRFKEDVKQSNSASTWPRRKAKKEHNKEVKEAQKLIIKERQRAKVQRKRMRRREREQRSKKALLM